MPGRALLIAEQLHVSAVEVGEAGEGVAGEPGEVAGGGAHLTSRPGVEAG